MAKKVKAVPSGYRTVTPSLMVKGGAKAMAFYKKAFGAKVKYSMMSPDGKWLAHAVIEIGDCLLMMSDEMPGGGGGGKSPSNLGGTTVGFYVYLKDVDAAFKRAVKAGAKVLMPLDNMFWGDRIGVVIDPFGHIWNLATHIEEISAKEMTQRGKEWLAKICK